MALSRRSERPYDLGGKRARRSLEERGGLGWGSHADRTRKGIPFLQGHAQDPGHAHLEMLSRCRPAIKTNRQARLAPLEMSTCADRTLLFIMTEAIMAPRPSMMARNRLAPPGGRRRAGDFRTPGIRAPRQRGGAWLRHQGGGGRYPAWRPLCIVAR